MPTTKTTAKKAETTQNEETTKKTTKRTTKKTEEVTEAVKATKPVAKKATTKTEATKTATAKTATKKTAATKKTEKTVEEAKTAVKKPAAKKATAVKTAEKTADDDKEAKELSLLDTWRQLAYASQKSKKESDMFWGNYFQIEKGIYQKILKEQKPVAGTVKELAEKFDVKLLVIVGFLDGINDSLKKPNPIETMTEDTKVNLDYDKETLFRNMVELKAEWLYTLEEWNDIFTEEEKKELYKAQKISHTIVKDKKVGRNDPCPCGSGKKYKFCCGK